MDENKSGLYIVAIVGVIAVVALVVLVTSAGRDRAAMSSGTGPIDTGRTYVAGSTDGLDATADSAGQVAKGMYVNACLCHQYTSATEYIHVFCPCMWN